MSATLIRGWWNYDRLRFTRITETLTSIGCKKLLASLPSPSAAVDRRVASLTLRRLLQHNYTRVTNLSTTVIPQYHCRPTNKLFDKEILSLPRWHRAKYYHILCQNQSNLTCFYDNDYFMCLCDIDQFANCFKFDYHRIYNCFGYNYCQNDGQCYQDNNTCPTSSSFFCREGYFGTQYQFTSTGFGLSLDDILGYSI